jgi:hypothetical protein
MQNEIEDFEEAIKPLPFVGPWAGMYPVEYIWQVRPGEDPTEAFKRGLVEALIDTAEAVMATDELVIEYDEKGFPALLHKETREVWGKFVDTEEPENEATIMKGKGDA